MKLSEIDGKRILLVGYGLEGKATHRFLKRKFPKLVIGIADEKKDPTALKNQSEFDLAIRSPGVISSKIIIPTTSATNIFFANTTGITIGVTGSKGKSTTSSLVYSILKHDGKPVHLGGNIGVPLLDLLDKGNPGDYFVCELSSYQLEDLHYSPHISVFLNFFPEHMDHHGSVELYWKAKLTIISQAKETDYFVYNSAYPQLQEVAHSLKLRATPFVDDLPISQLGFPLVGKHNEENIRAAITVTRILNIKDSVAIEAISNFKPLPHRLQYIGTYKDISFYDDALSTTPESTICAIESLINVNTIFLGGLNRGYEFEKLAKILKVYHIENVVLFPDSGESILSALNSVSYAGKILKTRKMEVAVRFAYKHTHKGSICLLSCASPSYSLWKNFEEKGNLFQLYVKKIGQV